MSACCKLFAAAREKGLRTIVEQTYAPRMVERRLLRMKGEPLPDWQDAPPDAHVEEFAARERQEWELADLIICGSQFVADGVAAVGGPLGKCVVVPYGVELGRFSNATKPSEKGMGPLRVLFVGTVGLRKGVPYLLDALRQLSTAKIVARLVGSVRANADSLAQHCPANTKVMGPVPRIGVAEQFRWADVFCLPSICEGSATVVYEALAAGLPVVTTPNAGSIVRDGVEGFIVPIRSADAIAEKLELLAGDRSLLRQMSEAARLRSAYGSLEAYGQRLTTVLSDLLSAPNARGREATCRT